MTLLGRSLLGKFSLALIFVLIFNLFSFIYWFLRWYLYWVCILNGYTLVCWVFVLHLCIFFFFSLLCSSCLLDEMFDILINLLLNSFWSIVEFAFVFVCLFSFVFCFFVFFLLWSPSTKSWHETHLDLNLWFSFDLSFRDFVFPLYLNSFWKLCDWF